MIASFLIEECLNGLQFGVMLFLIAAGLTLVLGIMNVVNLAYGSLYMAGAYFAVTIEAGGHPFIVALVAALLGTTLVGIAMEIVVIRPLYGRSHLDQVLCTIGLMMFFNELVRIFWGRLPLRGQLPDFLAGSVTLAPGLVYPVYRLAIVAVGLIVAVLLYLLVSHTRLGMLIRAGASDRETVGMLGANIPRLFTLIFGLGAALAGLAGMAAAPLLSVQVGMGEQILVLALVVIVIGGIGSIRGAFIAALLIGSVETWGGILLPPALASVSIYLFMAVVIVLRQFRNSARGRHSDSLAIGLGRHFTAGRSAWRSAPGTRLALGVGLAALLVLPLIARLADNSFLIDFCTRLMIFAIAAVSLNLLLGYGGMISLGHAAFLGIGAYTVAILHFHASGGPPLLVWPVTLPGSDNALVVWPAAIVAAGVAAAAIGAVSLRVSGLNFIMITLAFAQMIYYFFIALQDYGGADGLQIDAPSRLGPLDLGSRQVLYYLVLGVLVLAVFFVDRITRSHFGSVIQGIRQNERRLVAIGFSTFRYKLALFVMCGALAGFAGALLAEQEQFVSPVSMSWEHSGELMIMVILGGVGSLYGPVLGAFLYLVLEFFLSAVTVHWQAIFGPALIVIVLLSRGGLGKLLGGVRLWPISARPRDA